MAGNLETMHSGILINMPYLLHSSYTKHHVYLNHSTDSPHMICRSLYLYLAADSSTAGWGSIIASLQSILSKYLAVNISLLLVYEGEDVGGRVVDSVMLILEGEETLLCVVRALLGLIVDVVGFEALRVPLLVNCLADCSKTETYR